jgi:hypothetical protein
VRGRCGCQLSIWARSCWSWSAIRWRRVSRSCLAWR